MRIFAGRRVGPIWIGASVNPVAVYRTVRPHFLAFLVGAVLGVILAVFILTRH